MSGLQTFIAVFGGHEFRNRKLYSLTYGELRSVYFGALKKVILLLLVVYVVAMILMVSTSQHSVEVKSTSLTEKGSKAATGIGFAKEIQRKKWK